MRKPLGVCLLALGLLAAPGAMAAPKVPDAPEVSPKMEKRVARVARTIERIKDNCGDGGERNPMPRDRRCSRWMASVKRAGLVGVHAVGRTVLEESAERTTLGEEWLFSTDSFAELLSIMGQSKRPEAVTYLVRFLSAAAEESDLQYFVTIEASVRALEQLTGHNVAGLVPWTDLDAAPTIAKAWRTWHQDNAHRSRRQWLKDGRQVSRANLTSAALPARYLAIRRLVKGRDRSKAVASLIQLLESPTLPAEAREALVDLARRSRIPKASVRRANQVAKSRAGRPAAAPTSGETVPGARR